MIGGTGGHRRDSTMAALLTTMVLVFGLCHSLKAGLNIYEAYMVSGGCYRLLSKWSM